MVRSIVVSILSFVLCWPLLQLAAAPRYWVGGPGNWSDPMHWSAASGGPGGIGVPGTADDVFFDDNSFLAAGQTVVVDVDAFCRNMSWTNTDMQPILSGNADRIIEVGGSLTFSANMNHQFLGSYHLTSGVAGTTLTSNGQTFNQDLIFDNANGEWILTDDLTVLHTIDIRSGSFNSGIDGFRIEAQRFYSDYSSIRSIVLNASFIRLDQSFSASPTLFELGGANLFLDADQSVINLYGTEGEMTLSGPALMEFNLVVFEAMTGKLTSRTDQVPIFDQIDFNHNGEIRGDHQMQALRLANGFTYLLENGSRQLITDLLTGDECGGLVNVLAMLGTEEQAIIQFTNIPPRIDGLYLRGIRADNNPDVILSFSSDGGNNDGWFFDNLIERDLYWVGGTGDWNDRANWSETSGGPGGACIPTNVDRVIFDQNSFDSSDDVVTGSSPGYCNDFLFDVISFAGSITLPDLYVNNDLNLLTTVEWNVDNVYLIGNDEAGFSDAQSVETTQNSLINLISLSKRDVFVVDDLTLRGDLTISGTAVFRSNGNTLVARTLTARDAGVRLQLANSHITITGDRNGINMPLTIVNVNIASTANTIFDLTAETTGFLSDTGPLGTILFSNPDGTGIARSIGNVSLQKLEFEGNGQLQEETLTIDSLIFSAGKIYQLNGDLTLRVNRLLQSPGEICQPITFESLINGIQAGIFMPPEASIDMRYTQIGNVSASGGANFFAGLGSSEKANSPGWTFPMDNDNSVITQYLGLDRTLCSDSTLILRPFESHEIISIVWKDGTSDLQYEVPQSGDSVIATVVFPNTCEVTDTVVIDFDEAFDISLGTDTILCEGESLALDVEVSGAGYLWQDNSTDSQFTVDQPGLFRVTATRGQCVRTDNLLVDYNILDEVDLGSDRNVCETSGTILDPGPQSGATFTWQDGSDGPTLTPLVSGLYWVEIAKGRCTQSDSLNLIIDALPEFDLGGDTTLCQGENITLGTGISDGIHTWSNGMTTPEIIVGEQDRYSVVVERGACTVSDDIEVLVTRLAPFGLGPDSVLCEGETLVLTSGSADGQLLWSDGSTSDELSVANDGTYWLQSSEGTCMLRDSVEIVFESPPVLNLGPDTLLCEGESLLLSTGSISGDIAWSTGTTTPDITVIQAGLYSVIVDAGACTVQDTVEVNVAILPTPDLGLDRSRCEGESVNLSVTTPSEVEILWSDGSTDPSLRVVQSGTYWVELSIGHCALRDSARFIFDPALNFSIGPDTTLCPGDSLTLTTGIDDAFHRWVGGSEENTITVGEAGTYGVFVQRGECDETQIIDVDYVSFDVIDLGTDTILCEGETLLLDPDFGPGYLISWPDFPGQQSVNVQSPGDYVVQAGALGCLQYDTIRVDFQLPPTSLLPPDTTICEGSSLSLIGGMAGPVFEWSTGATTPEIIVTQAGLYKVNLMQGTCTVIDSVSVSIQALPRPSLANNLIACEGDIVVLDASVEQGLYLWNDGSTEPTIQVASGGLYTVDINLNGCSVNDSTEVQFTPNPVVELGEDITLCDGEVQLIGSETTGLTYVWNNGATGGEIEVGDAGIYSVTATDASPASCETSDSLAVVVRPLPFFELTEEIVVCEGESASIELPDNFDSYLWSSGQITSSVVVQQAGPLWATTELAGCSFSDTAMVRIQSFPSVFIGTDTVICEGDLLTLSATSPGAIYAWSTGSSSGQIDVSDPGTYSVDVNIDGCISTDDIIIQNKPLPVFDLGEDQVICENETTVLEILQAGWDISWTTGDMGPSIVVDNEGNYGATAFLDGCAFSDEVRVNFEPLPVFDLGGDVTKCEENSVQITADRSDVDISWNEGTLGPSIVISDPGTYTATAMTDLGCSFEASVAVANRECISFSSYMPTAFSPNGDGQNDFFRVEIPPDVVLHDYQLKIYDRWGNELFATRDPQAFWDGRFGGKQLKAGVYVVLAELVYSDDFNQNLRETIAGDLTLIH